MVWVALLAIAVVCFLVYMLMELVDKKSAQKK